MKKNVLIIIALFAVACSSNPPGRKASSIGTLFEQNPRESYKVNFESVLDKPWYTLPVTSGTQEKGFLPLFLPFKYTCVEGKPDPNQNLTFPALLSFKFNFVPSHHNPVQESLVLLKNRKLRQFDPSSTETIAPRLKEHNATHGITGEIVQHGGLYTGSMKVAGVTGDYIFQYQITEPIEYFRLMGKMTEAWIRFQGHEASKALTAELSRPMTGNEEILRLLGRAFEQGWGKELRTWEDILKKDKGFGEARYLYAKQFQEDGESNLMTGTALSDHLVVFALKDFRWELNKNSEAAVFYDTMIVNAIKLDIQNPNFAYVYLRRYLSNLSLGQLDTFNHLALTNPWHYQLLRTLGSGYLSYSSYEKALPLFLSAINTFTGKKDSRLERDYLAIVLSFWHLGYINEAIHFSLAGYKFGTEKTRALFLKYAGISTRELFLFDKAASFLEAGYNKDHNAYNLIAGILSLYEGGLLKEASRWDSKAGTVENGYNTLVDIRRLLSLQDYTGAGQKLKAFLEKTGHSDEEILLEAAIIGGDLNLLQANSEEAARYIRDAWYLAPRNRRVAFMLTKAVEDAGVIGPYAEVMGYIFPGEEYIAELLEHAKDMGYQAESAETIIDKHNRLAKDLKGMSRVEQNGYWLDRDPFSIEYLTLRLIRMKNREYKKAALKLFIAYSTAVKGISEYQKAHIRSFFYMLITGLPKLEKMGWIDSFETAGQAITKEN